jgi:DNA-binding winged helix-turn-helix (wHTH) protein
VARIDLRLPLHEKQAAQALAAHHGLSLSLYLRALVVADGERVERDRLLRTMYPEKFRTEDSVRV